MKQAKSNYKRQSCIKLDQEFKGARQECEMLTDIFNFIRKRIHEHMKLSKKN